MLSFRAQLHRLVVEQLLLGASPQPTASLQLQLLANLGHTSGNGSKNITNYLLEATDYSILLP